MKAEPREFTCVDCGMSVYTFVPQTPEFPENCCAVCSFLRTVKDLTTREQLREALHRDDTPK